MTQKQGNHFDKVSQTWDENPGRVKMAEKLYKVLTEELALHSSMHVLDFGAGTGLVSLRMLPHVASLTGLEPSEGMAAQFQKKIEADNHRNCTVKTFSVDDDPSKGLPHSHFDLIYSTMTFHHVHDVKKSLSELKVLLKPGGRLAILDLEKEDGTFHDSPDSGAVHLGFSFEEMESYLTRAGYRDISIKTAWTHKKQSTGREYGIFIATAGI